MKKRILNYLRQGSYVMIFVVSLTFVKVGLSLHIDGEKSVNKADSLIAHWSFDECSGATLGDDSAGGHHGIIFNATWTDTSFSGCGLSFGFEKYIEFSNDPVLITNSLTLEFWIMLRSYPLPSPIAYGSIFSNVDDDQRMGILLNVNHDGRVAFTVQSTSGEFGVTSNSILPLNTGVLIRATYNPTELAIYIDNELDTLRTGVFEHTPSNIPARIGNTTSRPDVDPKYIDAIIDEGLILSISEPPLHPIPDTTIAFWPFHSLIGDTFHDISGFGNHAINHGAQHRISPGVGGDSSYVSFDGIDDYLDAGTVNTSTGSITLEAFVSIDTLLGPGTHHTVFSKRTPSENEGDYLLRITGQGGVLFQIWSGPNNSEIIGSEDSTVFEAKKITHLAATFDGNSGTASIFIDDTLVFSRVVIINLPANDDTLWLGLDVQQGLPLDGRIDAARISDIALEPSKFMEYPPMIGISDEPGAIHPESFTLFQNHPNPFNPVTKISFDLQNSEIVKLIIYDIGGKEVGRVVDERLQSGSYSITWDAHSYPSGIYFYRLNVGDYSRTKKMILLK